MISNTGTAVWSYKRLHESPHSEALVLSSRNAHTLPRAEARTGKDKWGLVTRAAICLLIRSFATVTALRVR
jgi:hypothetical protein